MNRGESLPELWAALPGELAAGFDPQRPWEILASPFDAALAALPAQAIEIALDPRLHLAGDRIVLGAGTRIAPGATIHGPIRIGRGCVVGPGAVLRGGVWLEDGALVDAQCVLEKAIVLAAARLAAHCHVSGAVLGAGVRLGAGTVIAGSSGSGDAAVTDFALLGDGVVTGCNAVVEAGALVGTRARVDSGVVVRAGNWPADSELR